MKNYAQKVLGKQKKQRVKNVKTEVIPFIPRYNLHPSDICLYRNKAMSDIRDAELYSLITNVHEPPKKFDFPESERSFRFVWLEEFPWVCYSRWEDSTFFPPCVLSGNKVVERSSLENLYRKPYRTWPTGVKTLKKPGSYPEFLWGHRFLTSHLAFHFPHSTKIRKTSVAGLELDILSVKENINELN